MKLLISYEFISIARSLNVVAKKIMFKPQVGSEHITQVFIRWSLTLGKSDSDNHKFGSQNLSNSKSDEKNWIAIK